MAESGGNLSYFSGAIVRSRELIGGERPKNSIVKIVLFIITAVFIVTMIKIVSL